MWSCVSDHWAGQIDSKAHSTFAPVENLGMSPVPPCRMVFLTPSEPSNRVSCMSDIFLLGLLCVRTFCCGEPPHTGTRTKVWSTLISTSVVGVVRCGLAGVGIMRLKPPLPRMFHHLSDDHQHFLWILTETQKLLETRCDEELFVPLQSQHLHKKVTFSPLLTASVKKGCLLDL